MANYTKLTDLFTGIANSIRSKTGSTSEIIADNFPTSISGITTVQEGTADATASASDILSGKTAYVSGSKVTGSMANNGAISGSLNCGASKTIPAGYTSGGTITANSLASQTSATATAAQILTGQTAYVNGSKVTGTMTNQGAKTSSLNCGGSYTIPAGYHNGSGKITANSLASQTSATAGASDIASGKTAWVNGGLITGSGKILIKSGMDTNTINATMYGTYIQNPMVSQLHKNAFNFTANVGDFYLITNDNFSTNCGFGCVCQNGVFYYILFNNSPDTLICPSNTLSFYKI